MKIFFRMGVYTLLGVALATTLAGCHDDDPDYDNVIPPTVQVAPHTVSGVISAIDGTPLSGVSVSLDNATATTGADGVYRFSEVAPGSHSMKASAEGRIAQSGAVAIESSGKTQNIVWNASLPEDRTTEIEVSVEKGGQGTVSTESLKENEKAQVAITADIPAAVVAVDTKIEISPVYNEESVISKAALRAAAEGGTMLIGASISCASDVRLLKAIDLGFELDESLSQSVEARKYQDGSWQPAKSRVEGGKVIIEATEFTSYGLFLPVAVSVATGSEAIGFSQSKWDNLYGSGDMQVGEVSYTYKAGTEIASHGATMLEALLIEHLARLYGGTVHTLEGSYPVNVTLPIGTMLQMTGTQEKNTLTVGVSGKSVKGTNYGAVTVGTAVSNRNHTGSSN